MDLKTINNDRQDWVNTDLTAYARFADIQTLLESLFPTVEDPACGVQFQNYRIIPAGDQRFVRIRAPRALSSEEKQYLYDLGAGDEEAAEDLPI